MKVVEKNHRLDSLDILRGFNLFLLVFFQPVLVSIQEYFDTPWMKTIFYQLDHEVWIGFRFWDIVMPLFLFMTGVSMPFSLSKYQYNLGKKDIYKKIIRRFLILFVLGMVVQGNLLGFDFEKIYLYNNTLQAIAVGYLIAAFILLNLSHRNQILCTVILMLIYWLPMTLVGDFTPEGNLANHLDKIILGRFRGDPSYTWMLSSFTFGATVMLGAFAGKMIKSEKKIKKRVAMSLFIIGIILIVSGLLLGEQMPIIKRIWSCSMVLLSGGYCFLLMTLFYYWVDCKGYQKGIGWLKIYGKNSIVAYVLGETINFRSVAHSFSYGLEQYIGEYYNVWLSFANFLILFFILRIMHQYHIFIKI